MNSTSLYVLAVLAGIAVIAVAVLGAPHWLALLLIVLAGVAVVFAEKPARENDS